MAIEWGDNFILNQILDAGASIDALGSAASPRLFGVCICITPLTTAIMKNNLILVDRLISRGAAVNNPPNSADTSMTPLAAAIRNQHYKLVEIFIQRGANLYDSLALQEATNDIRLLQVLLTAMHSWDKLPDSKNVGNGALIIAIQKPD
jgi:ankyrin repeat protein